MKKLTLFLCMTLIATISTAGSQTAKRVSLDALERMTPAQIRRLSQDQIFDLLAEADRSAEEILDATMPLDGPHACIWPEAACTLHYAAGVSYDEWNIGGDYKEDPGADLRSNGCSFPVAAAYKKTFAATACRHHNYGYRNVAQYRQTHKEAVRKVLDIRFLLDMNWQCLLENASSASEHTCNLAAVAAYVQARKMGRAAFNAVTVRYP